ncbi:DNA topoisomerase 3 [Listeria welshimeri]|uniref:DNA topoisomerase 3 n=1 Tax=Listeria welshimeri TaxID=1643 RepID=UPI001886BFBB|nr:DNA topoisomerase 3 [Listeria welshimeri]MBF2568408.1 DNA topoisomerase 3 [Listeria welshimeri]
MKLLITEKPSVAQAIGKVLGNMKRQNGYLENEDFIVTWCIGHLVSLASTEFYDERYKKWSQADLPIIPDPFQYQVIEGKGTQYEIVKQLLLDERVTSIICATDAGREGELIFRLVYNHAQCKKLVERLWISSMEPSAIEDGMNSLKPIEKYDDLYYAALCRAQADWLVGINSTRLFSNLYNAKLNVGRVQTPTLEMLVHREKAINDFKKTPYYTVSIEIESNTFVSEKIIDRAIAEELMETCDSAVIRSITMSKKTSNPPKLYDLTTLQRVANRAYNLTAKQTLDALQVLYEKKLVTYPRTDSQFITSDMENSTIELIPLIIDHLPIFNGVAHIPDVKRLVNNSKVTDHHAILVTKEVERIEIKSLSKIERDILLLIAIRLLIATSPVHLFEEQVCIIESGNKLFTLKRKFVLEKGWKQFENRDAEIDEAITSDFQFSEGQIYDRIEKSINEHFTTPPKSFTEDTLLSAMEHASAEDESVEFDHKGLGTPATRAGIIERLVSSSLIERKGKTVVPTTKGIALIQLVPDELKSPKTTAAWEFNLLNIENGSVKPEKFMTEIRDFVEMIVINNQEKNDELASLFLEEKESIGECPRCHSTVHEFGKGFGCSNKECTFALWKENKFFTSKKKELTKRIAKKLLETGKCKVTKLYSEKTGKTYDAVIVMDDTGKYINFKLEFKNKKA